MAYYVISLTLRLFSIGVLLHDNLQSEREPIRPHYLVKNLQYEQETHTFSMGDYHRNSISLDDFRS